MNLILIRICSGCGKEFPQLEIQPGGKDYCSTNCFMEYNSPCELNKHKTKGFSVSALSQFQIAE